MAEYYSHGLWHAIIGLSPQYDHMKGTPLYDEYMKGYNSKDDKQENTTCLEALETPNPIQNTLELDQ